jgi:hypothetical protein
VNGVERPVACPPDVARHSIRMLLNFCNPISEAGRFMKTGGTLITSLVISRKKCLPQDADLLP